MLRNIMEGEALLNDASSITLFIVLLGQVRNAHCTARCTALPEVDWVMIASSITLFIVLLGQVRAAHCTARCTASS